MSPSEISADVIRRFRAARADGLSAAAAYRHAITPEPALAYEYCGDAVRLLIDDPELAGLEITATATPDDDPDRSWLGEYTSTWSADVIARPPSEPRHLPRYFLPSYTTAQRRADLSGLGYARGPAQVEAERQVQKDARLFLELDARIVTVSVRKAGVLLGEASVGADFGPDATTEDQLVSFASAPILDEAISEARAALPNLITALARGQESNTTQGAPGGGDTPILVAGALWGSLRTEQTDSGHTVLRIDPADPQAKIRVLLGDAELVDDRIVRDDIEVAVYRGQRDDRRVVHIDTFAHTGPIRINLNDGPAIYHGDPDTGRRFTEYTDF
ncbi:MAG: hypothetical protein HOQ24_17055 [Mycobacteriaceae bacterium]|nr:hypothetical protein [Mycobacteriaceae bacterium]